MNTIGLNIKPTGISILCDLQGKVVELLCDEIGLGNNIRPGHLFITAFEPASREKATNFLVELKLRGVTLDWVLSIMVEHRPTLLHFSGGTNGDTLFIVGTKIPGNPEQFFDELMKINNEQANKLREVIKQQVQASRSLDNRDSELYEELTELNNELANMQRELFKKNVELEQLNAELSNTIIELNCTRDELMQNEKMASLCRLVCLVSGFAHELNTPIGIAVGSASALQEEARKVKWLLEQEEVDVDELISAVSGIDAGFHLTLANLERASNLINSFKRTTIDQTRGKVSSFNVLEVLQDTLTTLVQFKKTAIAVHIVCPPDLNVVSFAGALEQMLINFLMNSLIHGFDDGKIAGEIHIHVHLHEGQLQLIYTDNGRGIAAENVEKIFEPFFTTHHGTGLGAYICYNLVTTQLKGTISCQSQLGQGVRFEVQYPVSLQM